MIYVKGSYGTFVMDREVSASDGGRLYSSRPSEKAVSGICESKGDTESPIEWWSRRRQDHDSESDVQRNRLRLHGNQWF